MMTLAGLREELAGLEFLQGREMERDVVEGRLHTRGAWCRWWSEQREEVCVGRGTRNKVIECQASFRCLRFS